MKQEFANYLSPATGGKRAYDGINLVINAVINPKHLLDSYPDAYVVVTIGANHLHWLLENETDFKDVLLDARAKAIFVDFRADELRPEIPARDNVYLLTNRVQEDLQEKYSAFTIVEVKASPFEDVFSSSLRVCKS